MSSAVIFTGWRVLSSMVLSLMRIGRPAFLPGAGWRHYRQCRRPCRPLALPGIFIVFRARISLHAPEISSLTEIALVLARTGQARGALRWLRHLPAPQPARCDV